MIILDCLQRPSLSPGCGNYQEAERALASVAHQLDNGNGGRVFLERLKPSMTGAFGTMLRWFRFARGYATDAVGAICSVEFDMKKREVLLLQLVVVLGAALSEEIAVAAETSLPPTQRVGQVTYLSGGVGSDQSRAIKDVMGNYPLVLMFVARTENGNEYLADVPVTITDMSGQMVLDTKSDGPFMLASLPNGRYTVTASYRGKTEQRTVNISAPKHARQMFIWAM